MKKCFKIVLITIITLNLLGCYNYDMEMTINKDKSVDFSFVMMPMDYEQITEGSSGSETIDDPDSNTQVNDPQNENPVTEEPDDSNDEPVEEGDGFWMPPSSSEATPQNQKEEESVTGTLENDISVEGETTENELDISYADLYGEDTILSLEERGYVVTIDDETGKCSIYKKFNHIDDISSSIDKKVYMTDFLNEDFDDSQFFTIEKSILKTTYKANFVFDLQSNEDVELFKELEALIEFNYKINLPMEADSHNAHTSSNGGKTLEWNLVTGEENEVNFSFSYYNMTIIYIGAAIIIAIIILIIILIVMKKRKKRSKEELVTPPPVQPVDETPDTNSEENNANSISFEVTQNVPTMYFVSGNNNSQESPSESVNQNAESIQTEVAPITSDSVQSNQNEAQTIAFPTENNNLQNVPSESANQNLESIQNEVAPTTFGSVESNENEATQTIAFPTENNNLQNVPSENANQNAENIQNEVAPTTSGSVESSENEAQTIAFPTENNNFQNGPSESANQNLENIQNEVASTTSFPAESNENPSDDVEVLAPLSSSNSEETKN